MKTQSRDTSEAAERVQIELMRAAGPVRRVQMAFSLSQSALMGSRHALCKARPGLDEAALKLEFVRLTYGEELAQRLARHLEARHLEARTMARNE